MVVIQTAVWSWLLARVDYTLTDMYDLVPTKELAMESISWPLTPKSHNLISPLEFTSMFDGLTSVREKTKTFLTLNEEYNKLTKGYKSFQEVCVIFQGIQRQRSGEAQF